MKEGKGTFSNACQASLVEVYIIALKETTIVSFHLTFLYLLFCFVFYLNASGKRAHHSSPGPCVISWAFHEHFSFLKEI